MHPAHTHTPGPSYTFRLFLARSSARLLDRVHTTLTSSLLPLSHDQAHPGRGRSGPRGQDGRDERTSGGELRHAHPPPPFTSVRPLTCTTRRVDGHRSWPRAHVLATHYIHHVQASQRTSFSLWCPSPRCRCKDMCHVIAHTHANISIDPHTRQPPSPTRS
jgi:hypothetical protein